MAPIRAILFDGRSARERAALISVTPTGVAVSVEELDQPLQWSYAGLRAISPPAPGFPLRLSHDSAPGMRLTISDQTLITDLLRLAPHLRHGLNPHRLVRFFAMAAGSLAAVAAVIYLLFTIAPQQLAFVVPDAWRTRLGDQVEKSFVAGARECTAAEGRASLERMAARLREGNPALTPFSLRVYDIPVTNAFALPGGRIVIFRQLIERAGAPDELAGVLAHEIGHISHRHAEAQLIRTVGVQLLISLATGGGSGGDTLGSFAGLLAILSYSRAAEIEADSFGRELLVKAGIDPLGLKRFFETIAREEGTPLKGVFGRIGNMMSTHPVTRDRIEAITPAGGPTRLVLAAADWQALRNICD